MEGRLWYAIAVFFGDSPTLYWLNYNQDAAALNDKITTERNNISRYVDFESAKTFLVEMAAARMKGNFMADLDGLVLKKFKLLGKIQPTTDDEVYVTFHDDVRMQIYKVMIGDDNHILIKEPTTFELPVRWTSKAEHDDTLALSA